jgi:hypothetical protein
MRLTSTPTRSRTAILTLVALALLATLGGCRRPTGQSIVLTKDQEQQIAENVLNAPPAIANKTEVKFEDKITLIGWETKGTPARRGGSFDMTLYFRVEQPMHGDWKVFMHFEAPGKRRQPFDHYGIGGLYPVSSWKKGEIIRDTVTVQVPADWPEGESQVLVGFFDWGAWTKASQDRRLKVQDAKGLTITGDGRLVVEKVQVGANQAGGAADQRPPRAEEPPAAYQVSRAASAPTLDGKIDDAAWEGIPPIGRMRRIDGESANAAYMTLAHLTWDDDNLYFAVTTRDDDIRNEKTENDTELWNGDVIELFLQIPGKNGEYVELQFAPTNARFDAKFTAHRKPEWQEAAKFESGVKQAVNVTGTVNSDADTDRGWSVEAAIPWKGLGLEAAPALGTRIAANVYRIDSRGTKNVAYIATWAPVGNDFHKLEGAGTLVLNGPRGRDVPPALLPPGLKPLMPVRGAPTPAVAAPAAPVAAPKAP